MLKKEIRRVMLRKRAAYTNNQIKNKSIQIKNILFNSFDFNKYNNIHIFLPIIEKKEINTFHIIDHIHNHFSNINVVVPKIEFTTNLKNNKPVKPGIFDNYYYHKNTLLKKNIYGIPEPTDSRQHIKHNLDMIIVPLLAINKQGDRIGYGGGYYDRFLASQIKSSDNHHHHHPITIGLSIESFIKNKIIDVESTDIKLDYCILSNDNKMCLHKF